METPESSEQTQQQEGNKKFKATRKVAKYFGQEFKHSSQVQEGSPIDYLQIGLKRIGSTKMGQKIKRQLDQNKK
ncbi:hypothetical protein DWB88_13690 (plasmid) [Staphylococcus warneri]|nr:hypothetical protein DWB88_13690 [Staphylococcus warneri]